jgi:hypothetical protein
MAIVYKIKRFTRAEKEAWKEFYKKTYNPVKQEDGTYKRMNYLPSTNNPRDVFRFKRLGADLQNLSKGDKSTFDREGAKILLNNAGMPKLAGQVDHIIDKYTNKKALARLARIKNISLSRRKKTSDELAIINKQNNTLSKLYERGKEQAFKSGDELDILSATSKKDPRVRNELMKESYKLGVPISYTPLYYNPKTDKIDPNNAYFSKSRVMTDSGKWSRPRVGIVLGRQTNDNNTLAHELGHAKSYISSLSTPYPTTSKEDPNINQFRRGRRRGYFPGKSFIQQNNFLLQKISNGISTLAEEKAANARGHAILNKIHKKLGVNGNNEMSQLAMQNKLNYSGGVLKKTAKDLYNYNNYFNY